MGLLSFRLPSAATSLSEGGLISCITTSYAKKSSLFEGVELAARCSELLPSAFGRQPSAFSSADSATGSADFKRPSKREVLSLHRRNLREIHLIYCLDRKTPKKGSLFEGVELAARGAGGRRAERRRSGTAQP